MNLYRDFRLSLIDQVADSINFKTPLFCSVENIKDIIQADISMTNVIYNEDQMIVNDLGHQVTKTQCKNPGKHIVSF